LNERNGTTKVHGVEEKTFSHQQIGGWFELTDHQIGHKTLPKQFDELVDEIRLLIGSILDLNESHDRVLYFPSDFVAESRISLDRGVKEDDHHHRPHHEWIRQPRADVRQEYHQRYHKKSLCVYHCIFFDHLIHFTRLCFVLFRHLLDRLFPHSQSLSFFLIDERREQTLNSNKKALETKEREKKKERRRVEREVNQRSFSISSAV